MNRQKRLMFAVAVLILLASLIFSAVVIYTAVSVTGAATSGEVGFCKMGFLRLGPIANQSTPINVGFNLSVATNTSDCGEPVTFSSLLNPALVSFFLNSSTGLINFTPNTSDAGVYTVTILGQKQGFSANSTVFTLNITGCQVGPVNFDSISSRTAYPGFSFGLVTAPNEPDCSETLTFASLVVPSLNSFVMNSSTGMINFTPQSGEEGSYSVTVYGQKSGVDINSTSFTLYINTSIAPTNLTCSRGSNASRVDIDWNTISDVSHYNVYYSSNISAIMNWSSTEPLTGNLTRMANITTSNWTDTSAWQDYKRYYLITGVKSGSEYASLEMPCAKLTYSYTVPTSSTYGPLASNRVAFYLNKTYTAETFLQEIPAGNNPTISRLDKSNASGEYYTTHVRGLSDGNNFNIDPTIAYLITSDSYFNHTIVGRVYRPPYNVTYDAPTSSVYGRLSTNARGPYDSLKDYTAETFLQEISAGLNPTISRLDKSNASGEYLTTHVRGLSDGNNFEMPSGVGYLITVDGYYNHTICVTCFK